MGSNAIISYPNFTELDSRYHYCNVESDEDCMRKVRLQSWFGHDNESWVVDESKVGTELDRRVQLDLGEEKD